MDDHVARLFAKQEEDCGFREAHEHAAIEYLKSRRVFCMPSIPEIPEDKADQGSDALPDAANKEIPEDAKMFQGLPDVVYRNIPEDSFYMVYWDSARKGYYTDGKKKTTLETGAATSFAAKFARIENGLGRIVLYPRAIAFELAEAETPLSGTPLPGTFTAAHGVVYELKRRPTDARRIAIYWCERPPRLVPPRMRDFSDRSMEIARKLCEVPLTTDATKIQDFLICVNRHGLKLAVEETAPFSIGATQAVSLLVPAFDSIKIRRKAQASFATKIKSIPFGKAKEERMACALLLALANNAKDIKTFLWPWEFDANEVRLMCSVWDDARPIREA